MKIDSGMLHPGSAAYLLVSDADAIYATAKA